MNTLPSRIVAASRGDTDRAWEVFNLVLERLTAHPQPPQGLIGDLVLALMRPRPALREVGSLPGYFEFLKQLTRARRWNFLVTRLGQLARRPRNGQNWRNVSAYVVESMIISLWSRAGDVLAAATTEEQLLETSAEAYLKADENSSYQDFSALLLDDLAMAMTELMRRARTVDFKGLLPNEGLIRACLEAPIDTNDYRPRLLCETMREGEKQPKLDGDHLDLRAITVKTREEHIPRILPYELAANHWRGRLGRSFTLDKVINRSPAIWQHHQLQRPELEHRILIVVLMGVTRHLTADAVDVAELSAKALGFSLLINAALKVPHDLIQADVAWFQRDTPDAASFDWSVQFPLAAVRAAASEGERWRNVVEVDRHLPRFFANFGGSVDLLAQSEYILIREHPIDYLTRAGHGKYHGVFIVGLAPPGEAASLVPATSLALPPLPPGVPPVMLATAGPDARRGLRGATFPSLLAARMAPAVLPPPPPEAEPAAFLVEEFLKMIVGPLARRTSPARPRSPEVKI